MMVLGSATQFMPLLHPDMMPVPRHACRQDRLSNDPTDGRASDVQRETVPLPRDAGS